MATRTIEIKGVKFDVDTRYLTRVDELRVGNRVKVLTKDYSGYTVHPGVVVGFDMFKNLPTVRVAYVDQKVTAYGSDKQLIKVLAFNAESKDLEVILDVDMALDLSRSAVLQMLDRQEQKLRADILELEQARAFFEAQFGTYWKAPEQVPEPETVSEAPSGDDDSASANDGVDA